MLSVELQIITILRALAEVAGLFLLAQGALFLLAGKTRDKNIVYQLFRIVTRPAISVTRFLMPKLIVDKHIPWVAFFLIFWLWIALAYLRQLVCTANNLSCG